MSTNADARPQSSRRTFLTAGAAALAGGASVGAVAAGTSGVSPALTALVARLADLAIASKENNRAHEVATEAWKAAGGYGERPEALIVRENDWEMRLTAGAILEHGREVYDAKAVAKLRGKVHDRFTQLTRPATQADGFRPDAIARGELIVYGNRRDPWPEAQARADEIVAAWDARLAHIEHVREAFGLTALWKADDALGTAMGDTLAEIRDFPARTLPDILFKAQAAINELDGDEWQDELKQQMANADTWTAELGLSLVRDLRNLGMGA